MYVFLFLTNIYRFVCTCQYNIGVRHNVYMKAVELVRPVEFVTRKGSHSVVIYIAATV